MNRITSHMPSKQFVPQGHPAWRAERKLRHDVEQMLRDMAFVLKMTQRVKSEILKKSSTNESLAV